jgi:hypothetical protein
MERRPRELHMAVPISISRSALHSLSQVANAKQRCLISQLELALFEHVNLRHVHTTAHCVPYLLSTNTGGPSVDRQPQPERPSARAQ